MARGVTTEWEDIHVKLGNYVARPKSPTMEELSKKSMEKAEGKDPLAKKSLEELKEFEDDLDDDFLEEYRKKKLEEMKAAQKSDKYGKLMEISKEDYIAEVTNAPKDVYVVISLYQDYIKESLLVNKYLDQLAFKHRAVKFVKIIASKCLEKLHDESVPSLLVYLNGKIIKQLIPLKHFVILHSLTCKGIF